MNSFQKKVLARIMGMNAGLHAALGDHFPASPEIDAAQDHLEAAHKLLEVELQKPEDSAPVPVAAPDEEGRGDE